MACWHISGSPSDSLLPAFFLKILWPQILVSIFVHWWKVGTQEFCQFLCILKKKIKPKNVVAYQFLRLGLKPKNRVWVVSDFKWTGSSHYFYESVGSWLWHLSVEWALCLFIVDTRLSFSYSFLPRSALSYHSFVYLTRICWVWVFVRILPIEFPLVTPLLFPFDQQWHHKLKRIQNAFWKKSMAYRILTG